MSSNIFSKKINISNFNIIYTKTQKNLKPTKTTLYIIKKNTLKKSTSPFIPTYLNLKTHTKKNSIYNTPPIFSIYITILNLKHLLTNNNIKTITTKNTTKTNLLYSKINTNPLIKKTITIKNHSQININFLLTNNTLKTKFNKL